MNTKIQYVPILKAKKGEYDALRDLGVNSKSTMLPLIEALNIPWNYETEEPARTIDKHLEKFAEKLEKSWGTDYPVLVDFPDTLFSSTMKNGIHAITHVFDDARSRKLKAIPVLGLDRPDIYKEEVKGIVAKDGRGICLRIEREDFQISDLAKKIQDLISELNISPDQVDILLDYKDILPGQEGILFAAVKQSIASLPNIPNWRNIIFSASSFPKTIAFKKNTMGNLPRTEWAIYELLSKNEKDLERLPIYSDYAISHPELVEVDPRVMLMSANLRYTSDSEWVIIKGSNVRKNGYEQFADLCETMTTLAEYKGKDHCPGCTYISDCKDKTETSGNASTWRWIGVVHHMNFVLEQLSNLPVS